MQGAEGLALEEGGQDGTSDWGRGLAGLCDGAWRASGRPELVPALRAVGRLEGWGGADGVWCRSVRQRKQTSLAPTGTQASSVELWVLWAKGASGNGAKVLRGKRSMPA